MIEKLRSGKKEASAARFAHWYKTGGKVTATPPLSLFPVWNDICFYRSPICSRYLIMALAQSSIGILLVSMMMSNASTSPQNFPVFSS